MKINTIKLLFTVLVTFVLISVSFESKSQTTIINYGDSWKYLDDNTRPSGWETVSYNDGAWASGASPLGYKYDGVGYVSFNTVPNPATITSFGTNFNSKYITTYFRKTINIPSASSFSMFTISALRDDGIVIYVNGVEVGRDNLPGGTITHSTTALNALDVGSYLVASPVTYTISPCYFVNGDNTIAVEVHQQDKQSSDLYFNFLLQGITTTGTPTLVRSPYLQSGSQTAMTLRWRTDIACVGRVKIGTANGTYTLSQFDESCNNLDHSVRVTGLSADTKYFYEISTTSGTVLQSGASNFFTTSPSSSTTKKLRVAAFGDCGGSDIANQTNVLSRYKTYLSSNGVDAADALILLGDNAYNNGTDGEYTSKFFDVYGPDVLKNHKLYPSPGNHDYADILSDKKGRFQPYFNVFTVPQSGESGSGVASNKPNYYSYDVGNIHFMSLDSYGIEPEDITNMRTTGSSALKTWLNADLAAANGKWKVAYWHHPPYTKGSYDSDTDSMLNPLKTAFVSYLEERGVDLVICAHSHVYERSYLMKNYNGTWTNFNAATNAQSSSTAKYDGSSNSCPYVYNTTPLNHGTVYVVAGTAGSNLPGSTFTGFGQNIMPFASNEAGFFYFEVEDNRLDAKMIKSTGEVLDQFTIMKDVNQSATYSLPVNGSMNLTASWPSSSYVWNTGSSTARTISVTQTDYIWDTYTVADSRGCITDNFQVRTTINLPTDIIGFDAVARSKKVNISWTTTQESNNSHFTLERSSNGSDFTFLARIEGAGNSSSKRNYNYVDASPLAGQNFYRLAQTDYDGKKTNFGVKRVENKEALLLEARTVGTGNGLLKIEIDVALQGLYNLEVFDMNGRKFYSESLSLNPGITAKNISLTKGTYIWSIRNAQGDNVFQKVYLQ